MKKYVKSNMFKKLICSLVLISILFSTIVFPINVYAETETGAKILSRLADRCESFVGFEGADNKYNNFVNKLKKDDSRNSVQITANNTILVNATSKEAVVSSLFPECCTKSEAELIVGNNYTDVIEVKIISTEPTTGETDTRTETEKIEDKLVEKGYSKTEAKIIVENNGYKVNEDGTVTVTMSAEDQRNLGVSDPTIAQVEAENKSDWADELGGVLLRPIFALVNFIADSVIKITGKTMFPEAYGTGTTEIMTDSPVSLGYKTAQKVEVDVSDYEALSGDYYPQFRYTPEEIFSGQVNILSIDFISGKDSDGNTITNEGWSSLRKVIAGWYKALRLIAAIGLLSVLIYTGIKIIISSTAKDKAKYKEWIINWFIAALLLFTMHYIMSFIITINSEISNLLYTSSTGIEVVPVTSDGSENTKIQTFTTNLMGLVRFHILEQSFKNKIAYEIMYIALIVYTLKFTFVYLKRVMNMAFLTLVAPIVALTYPIDKMNDGRAQGFEMWLKEYIFNALLQILHFLLYHILISSAIELAANNPIYAIVVLGFMNEAERLLKTIFGFDKAGGGTVGGMATAFAATSVASSLRSIGKLGKGPGGKGPGGKDDNKINDFKPNTIDGTKGLLVDSNAQAPLATQETTSRNATDGNGGINNNRSNSQGNSEHDSNPNLFPDKNSEFDNEPDDEFEIKFDYDQENGTYLNEDQDITNLAAKPKSTLEQQNSNIGARSQPIATPIQDIANEKEEGRLKKIGKGLGSLGKAAVRPIYDFDKTGAYNGKRLARNIARGALGAGMGITAAAVQAGISITDGKYNPMEAVAAFSAGYAGAGVVTNKVEGIGNTFADGYNAGDNDAKMKKAMEDFKNRDDVIASFKKKYGDDWKKQRERAAENYFAYGETDVSKMIKNMDNADKLMKANNAVEGNQQWDRNQADTQIRNIEKARKELKDMNMYGKIMNDNEQAEKFVQSQVQSYVKNELKGVDDSTKRAEYEGKVRTLLSQMRQYK